MLMYNFSSGKRRYNRVMSWDEQMG